MNDLSFSRRQAIGALSAGVATITLSPSRAFAQSAGGEAQVAALFNSVAENLLHLYPESATSLGVDEGARAGLRAQLRDRSEAGQQRIAQTVRADLARVSAIDASGLPHATRTSVEVVRSAFTRALEGFSMPYGDVPVAGDSWRKTPYVVIQNVGAYLDVPRFLDTDHRVENAADAEAYLARLESYASQLDGELGRLKSAAGKGLVAPAFLIDKAISQMTLSIKGAREGGGLVESLERRTKGIPGDWAARARSIAQQKVAPALERQLAELQAQRPRATMDAGLWARPHGPEFYAWALKASTTTNMTPDEIHQMGLDQVAQLHGQMDVILKSLGYTKGTVGARMTALSDDPRYKFAEGDPGRAEIMAFIQERLRIIRAQLPRAFRTLVRGNLEVKRLPPEEEPGAPGAYGGAGSIDGSIPGKFWINLRTPTCTADMTWPISPIMRRSRVMSGRANIQTSCR